MRVDFPRLTPTRLFWLLMALAAIMFLMPRRFTDGFRSVSQLLVPGQYVLYSSTSKLGETVQAVAEPPVSREEHRRVAAENEALTTHLVALENEVGRLRRQNERLAGLRENESLKPFRLIRARVVAEDVVAYRDKVIVDQGKSKGISPADWVATHRFVDVGEEGGVRPELAVLAAEYLGGDYLIGRVEQVHPYVSRVRLFTDAFSEQAPVRVRIGRRDGTGNTLAADADGEPIDFLLRGAGNDTMRVTEVERALWDDGRIREGDLVFTSPHAADLPRAMIVGTVTEMTRDRSDNELLCELTVTWPFEWTTVREVYIIAPPRED